MNALYMCCAIYIEYILTGLVLWLNHGSHTVELQLNGNVFICQFKHDQLSTCQESSFASPQAQVSSNWRIHLLVPSSVKNQLIL